MLVVLCTIFKVLQVPRILTVTTFEEEEEEDLDNEEQGAGKGKAQQGALGEGAGGHTAATAGSGGGGSRTRLPTQARRGSFAFWDIGGGGGAASAVVSVNSWDAQQHTGSGGGASVSGFPTALSGSPPYSGLASSSRAGGGGGTGAEEDDDLGLREPSGPLRHQGSSGIRSSGPPGRQVWLCG